MKQNAATEPTTEELDADDAILERAASVESIRTLLEHFGRCLSIDWGDGSLLATDEFSYDLGTVHGIQIALAALESLSEKWPTRSEMH